MSVNQRARISLAIVWAWNKAIYFFSEQYPQLSDNRCPMGGKNAGQSVASGAEIKVSLFTVIRALAATPIRESAKTIRFKREDQSPLR
jgi:hypothetical protein